MVNLRPATSRLSSSPSEMPSFSASLGATRATAVQLQRVRGSGSSCSQGTKLWLPLPAATSAMSSTSNSAVGPLAVAAFSAATKVAASAG